MDPRFSRRSMLFAAAALAAPPLRAAMTETPPLFDHMQLACNDLDQGIALVEQKLGVRAAFGGVHPGRGSRNALLALGERRYLEIIAPDPAQPRSNDVRQLYKIESPRLIGWAAHVDDIAAVQKNLSSQSIAFEPVRDGSRKRPSGQVLRWKALSLKDDRGGLLPFFIEWSKDSPHPSSDAPQGCRLSSFAIATPDPDRLRSIFGQLQVEAAVAKDRAAELRAKLQGPKGSLPLP